jgi:hypothetical protein
MRKDQKEQDKKEKEKAEYEEGLKKTLTPLLFGILAGIICFVLFVYTPYLDSPNGGLKEELDNGTVPETLIAVFEARDIPLSKNSTVIKEGDDNWLINEGDTNKTYIVRKEAEKLTIYTPPESEDWLLIALLLVLVQKFVYPFLHTSIKGAKDWIYISFMTIFCWFITFTLLLMGLFS